LSPRGRAEPVSSGPGSLAIRGFGLASLIGEVTCVVTALVLVPALLALGRKPVAAAGASMAA
jgi:hypothetical protein